MFMKLGKINGLRGKALLNFQIRNASQHLKAFATVDLANIEKHKGMNLVQGEWVGTENYREVVDPMTGKHMLSIPDTSLAETEPFIESLKGVPKHGLHNPFKNKDRYLMLG